MPRGGIVKHGMRRTVEYRAWQHMNTRCRNPRCDQYPNYGGRGIKVCQRWRSFANFYADMGPKPTRKHSLEREDTNGDYTPDNCKWATMKKQQNNRRNNRRITIDGETKTAMEWCEIKGIGNKLFYARLKIGWSEKDALNIPKNPSGVNHFRAGKLIGKEATL